MMERASGGAERRRGEAPPNTPGDEDKQILCQNSQVWNLLFEFLFDSFRL